VSFYCAAVVADHFVGDGQAQAGTVVLVVKKGTDISSSYSAGMP
jgi:hypothetical protein